MKDLAGKTAFITGAASGIGLGVATSLAQAGVKVMLCDIEQGALDAAVARLKATNADVEGVKADVSLKAELQAAAQATLDRYGEVHNPAQQCRRRRLRPLRHVKRRGMGVDDRRQPDGGDLGRRDLRPVDRAAR
jgi:NAD(P)-dependent dehydrogenase (short-subunit alcohol dehydrogenase family)